MLSEGRTMWLTLADQPPVAIGATIIVYVLALRLQ